MKKSILAIVNPVSGNSSKEKVVKQLNEMRDDEFDITVVYTERPDHATELAAEAAKRGVGYVIAVGGDGTVNEVAKALVGTDTALGIIPHGSGNGLARHLRIPMKPAKAIKALCGGEVQKVDYGIANDNLFFCTCGVGYDALVSEKALYQKKRGIMMYAKNMFGVFVKFVPENYKVTAKEGTYEGKTFAITCANASQYGNDAFIAPKADIQDGKMNIVILRPLSFWAAPRMGIQLFTKRMDHNPNASEIISSEVHIEREKEGVMHLDGNAVYTGKDVDVKIVPGGLKVIMPRVN